MQKSMNHTPMSAEKKKQIGLGSLALLFYLVHALYWILEGAASNAIWACHLGALLISTGWLILIPALNAVGTLWLGLGNLLWISDLLAGATFYPTSALTHLGGIAVGIWGVAEMGIPKRSWLRAALGLIPLWLATRWLSDPGENVNMAFRVYSGWEGRFPHYWIFLALLLSAAALLFFFLEKALARIVRGRNLT
jgi:hypothetical protein